MREQEGRALQAQHILALLIRATTFICAICCLALAGILDFSAGLFALTGVGLIWISFF